MTELPFAVFAEALKTVAVTVSGDPRTVISGLANNSGEVAPGALFCAIRGAKTDGHRYLSEAVKRGAAAYAIAEDSDFQPPSGQPVIRVRDSYLAWALLCETFFHCPAANLNVYAVTGTNGKTTTAYLLRRIFHAAFPGETCGLLSTVEYDTGTGRPEAAARTTPDALEFQRLFTRMRENRCRRAVMELSSHGLHQHRTGSLRFAGAILTNVTGDHLDYHGNMENYYRTKRILFTELLRPEAPAVINLDDAYGRRLAGELRTDGRRVLGLTLHDEPSAEAKVRALKLHSHGADFLLETPCGELRLTPGLTGEYNVCNIAGAAVLALAAGIDGGLLERTLTGPDLAPPGRLEAFELPNGARVLVDYAHTDDALFRVLSALRAVARGRLITVFGCGGDRDKTKRPRMAAAAAGLSDAVWVTSDNPRTEDPLSIIADIRAGFPVGFAYKEEPDRAKAIAAAVNGAEKGDFILIAGKGHENSQEIDGVKYPFDDREVVRTLIRKMQSKRSGK